MVVVAVVELTSLYKDFEFAKKILGNLVKSVPMGDKRLMKNRI